MGRTGKILNAALWGEEVEGGLWDASHAQARGRASMWT